MYCLNCGNRLPDNAKFCNFCGRPVWTSQGTYASQMNTIETKSFYFRSFSNNANNINEINRWLAAQKIYITTISTSSNMNAFYNQTVIQRCQINYRKDPQTQYMYQMGFFSIWRWMHSDYAAVDNSFQQWKWEHPDCTVVYSTTAGHIHNGHTTSVFFLYKTKVW